MPWFFYMFMGLWMALHLVVMHIDKARRERWLADWQAENDLFLGKFAELTRSAEERE
jgi:hypothetical protein